MQNEIHGKLRKAWNKDNIDYTLLHIDKARNIYLSIDRNTIKSYTNNEAT